MKMLLNEKTKQEKIMNEVQKKRNLFGLGLTSLIAACSATDKATNGATETAPEAVPLEPADDTLIAVAVASERAGNLKDLQITVTPGQRGLDSGDDLIFRIADGDHDGGSRYAKVYTGLAATNKHDLVVLSANFDEDTGNGYRTGGIYIFWDIKGKTADDLGVTTEDIMDADGVITGTITQGDAGKTLALKHLKVKGSDDNILSATRLEFYHIGGEVDQADMLFKSSGSDLNILWDVTKHATTTDAGGTELTLDSSPGILRIPDVGEFYKEDYSFIKINDNKDYDLIVKSNNSTYILWDITNYYDPAATVATPAITLATAANTTHGLLKIEGLAGNIMKAADEGGLTDIDGGGINDLAFDIAGNIYILFGEKVANMDEDGKAISYTVVVETIDTSVFYDKTGDDRTAVTATAPAEKQGFFDYDLDGDDMTPDVANIGYRFAATKQNDLTTLDNIKTEYDKVINPPAADGALSEEAYWDIA